MTGGTGADSFRFTALADSVVGTSRDLITAFSQAEGDRIDLATIDANTRLSGNQAFAFIGDPLLSSVMRALAALPVSFALRAGCSRLI
jgi:Ca2+-binding RTX toxin-like protein